MSGVRTDSSRSTGNEAGSDPHSEVAGDAGAKGEEAHIFDYREGGAGDERTVSSNVEALDVVTFVPRMLCGVERPDLRTTVVGGELAAPLLVAPMGLQAMYHPDAEAATAAAATELGLGFCLSAMSSAAPEVVRDRAGDGLLWRQVYVMREERLTRQLIEDAERYGFAALVCTVDVPVVGRRTRDRYNGFDRFASYPPWLVSSPAFRALVAERAQSPRQILDNVFPNPACGWDDIKSVIRGTCLPVLVKGILHPDDARRAVDIGVHGIVVSNHGGRQLDRSVSAAAALPGVRAAVGSRVAVYLDSGVRTGTHAAAALALGADAVLVGRPALRALARAGHRGVADLLHELVTDLSHVMSVVGVSRPAELRDVR